MTITEHSPVALDRSQHATVVTALIHYALHVADVSAIVDTLDTIAPNPRETWEKIIGEARYNLRASLAKAEDAS